MDLEVADNPDKERFEILADSELAGFAQYHLRDAEIAFTHTQIDDRFRGQGMASASCSPAWTRPGSGSWRSCPTARS